jgi:MoxR-like ATPase
VAYVQRLRQMDLFKVPGVAESIDWATALTELDRLALDPQTISDTLGVLLKYQDDIARLGEGESARLLEEVRSELATAD